MSYPDWVWLYFGSFGTVGALLFTFIVWYWMKAPVQAGTRQDSAAAWNMVGMMFLFAGAWFACGIAGPPGNALSQDISLRDLDIAYFSAMLSVLLSIPGWACLLIGMRKMTQIAPASKNIEPQESRKRAKPA
jgi:hypothetical protein